MFNFSTHLRYLPARPTVGLQNELSNVTGEAPDLTGRAYSAPSDPQLVVNLIMLNSGSNFVNVISPKCFVSLLVDWYSKVLNMF